VKKALEAALAKKMGKPFGALMRSAAEMQGLAAAPPFAEAPPNFVYAHFFDEPLAKGALDGAVAPGGERWELRGRELFVHYPNGAGQSKLKLPVPKTGTARNLNTVRKLAEMAAALT
jgi:uncharacterized protein (DUF1697 family)